LRLKVKGLSLKKVVNDKLAIPGRSLVRSLQRRGTAQRLRRTPGRRVIFAVSVELYSIQQNR
jgi:hypothetical protein